MTSSLRYTPTPCGCRPGRESDGWHEVRSAECDQAEHDAFVSVLTRVREELIRSA